YGDLPRQPLQRTHRHGIGTAEQQREQRNEKAHADPFEQHHDERAGQRRKQQAPPRTEVRPELRQETPDVGRLIQPGFHRDPPPGYSAFRRSSSSSVFGQSLRSSRDNARSASRRPPVWHGAQ